MLVLSSCRLSAQSCQSFRNLEWKIRQLTDLAKYNLNRVLCKSLEMNRDLIIPVCSLLCPPSLCLVHARVFCADLRESDECHILETFRRCYLAFASCRRQRRSFRHGLRLTSKDSLLKQLKCLPYVICMISLPFSVCWSISIKCHLMKVRHQHSTLTYSFQYAGCMLR